MTISHDDSTINIVPVLIHNAQCSKVTNEISTCTHTLTHIIIKNNQVQFTVRNYYRYLQMTLTVHTKLNPFNHNTSKEPDRTYKSSKRLSS